MDGNADSDSPRRGSYEGEDERADTEGALVGQIGAEAKRATQCREVWWANQDDFARSGWGSDRGAAITEKKHCCIAWSFFNGLILQPEIPYGDGMLRKNAVANASL